MLLLEIATRTPPSPRVFNPDIPEELADVVLRAFTRDRDERFPDVASLARALEPFTEGVRFRPPRRTQFRHSVVDERLAGRASPSEAGADERRRA